MALIPNPKVLILDEPFEGLDPIMSRTVEVSLRKASERGLTILITTHVLTAMNDLLVKYGILSSGKLVVCGDMQTLREQGISLQDAYLQEFGVVQEPELSWLG